MNILSNRKDVLIFHENRGFRVSIQVLEALLIFLDVWISDYKPISIQNVMISVDLSIILHFDRLFLSFLTITKLFLHLNNL